MPDNSVLPSRKADHIKINLQEDVSSSLDAGFDKFQFVHNALPEIDLNKIDTGTEVFGRKLKAPVLISSMTGGTSEAFDINQKLARNAQKFGLAMGLGSQRAALENPELAYSYQIRDVAPDILLFANLGAVQLNYTYTVEHCLRAVDMVRADALFLHLNSIQEALQPEGDTNFSGLLHKIEQVCKRLTVPVIVKEVGWGISGNVARQLRDAGVQGIDVAGAGGTSWSQVEYYRINDENKKRLALDFRNWGISTLESLIEINKEVPGLLNFASGGIRNGLDIAKSIRLGASLAGIAGLYLRAAAKSEDELDRLSEYLIEGLRISMFGTGCRTISDLKSARIKKLGEINGEI